MMDLDGVTAWLALIAAAGAALSALLYIGSRVRRGIRRTRRLVLMVEQWTELMSVEMSPNHGSSMKDRVAKIPEIEQEQKRHGERLARVEDTLSANTAALARLVEALPIIALSHPPTPSPLAADASAIDPHQ